MAKKTLMAFCLDSSGSMGHLRRQVPEVFNATLEAAKHAGKDHDVQLALIEFNTYATTRVPLTNVRHVNPLNWYDYRTTGLTALFDAVKVAVDTLHNARIAAGDEVAFLLNVFTDGEENGSMHVNRTGIQNLIADLEATGKWTVAFQVPPGGRASARRVGVPADNIREWEGTASGVEEAVKASAIGTRSYFDARAKGQTALRKFYAPVTTDLSTVDKADLLKKLQNVAGKYRALSVEKEAVVKEFVESKTKAPYIIGGTYYQLMKTEKIQPNKSILIQPKGTKEIYGGVEARQLLGLPDGQHAKVTPGNHAGYEIFVESRSVNRKLPRGTKVLVDVTKHSHSAPTWGTAP